MKQIFGDAVVDSIFTALGQQFVVHGKVELSHGLSISLLATQYQLLHTVKSTLPRPLLKTSLYDFDTSYYIDSLVSVAVRQLSSYQVITNLV